MRIWDVHPGYLARQQLLGEHRELHGMFNILSQGKRGYSKHPETLRWVGCLAALTHRHDLLVAEMQLRGYQHHSPLPAMDGDPVWPTTYIDAPHRQFEILAEKYAADQRMGRIPLPADVHQLWQQHQHAIRLINPALHEQLEREFAEDHGRTLAEMSRLLIESVRQWPDSDLIRGYRLILGNEAQLEQTTIASDIRLWLEDSDGV